MCDMDLQALQAARLFVGAQFSSRDDLDAVINSWATRHSTRLALCPGHTGKLRWTCASWTHPGLDCKHRDCIVEVEVVYSSDCGYWRVEALTTQHMSEAQWQEWATMFLQIPDKLVQTSQGDLQSTCSAPVADSAPSCLQHGALFDDKECVGRQGIPSTTSQVSLLRNNITHPQAPLPQPTSPDVRCKLYLSNSSGVSPASTLTVRSEDSTGNMPSKNNKMAISSLCHPHDQTPSPARSSQASASAATPRRPQRVPNVIKADLERIARARRLAAQASAEKLAAEKAAAESAAAEAAALSAAQLAEDLRVEEEKAALIKAAEQKDIEQQAAAERAEAEAERDALAILASQAAHQLDGEDDLASATLDKSSDLSAISHEMTPPAMEDRDNTPSEQADDRAQPAFTNDTTSTSFRTAEGFVEWANDCLEASHEMSVSDKKSAGKKRKKITIACQNGRKNKLLCPWKVTATKRYLAGSSIRWEVEADAQEHSKACIDAMDTELLKKYQPLLAQKFNPLPKKQAKRQWFGKPKVAKATEGRSTSPEDRCDSSDGCLTPTITNGALDLPPAAHPLLEESSRAMSDESARHGRSIDTESPLSEISGTEIAADDHSHISLQIVPKAAEGCSERDCEMPGTAASNKLCPDKEDSTIMSSPDTAEALIDGRCQASFLAETADASAEADVVPPHHSFVSANTVDTLVDASASSVEKNEFSKARLAEVNVNMSSLQIDQALPHQNPTSSPKSHVSRNLASESTMRKSWPVEQQATPVAQRYSSDSDMPGLVESYEDYPSFDTLNDPGNLEDIVSDYAMNTETTPELIASMDSNRQPSPSSSLTPLPSEDELLTPASGSGIEAPAVTVSNKGKRSRARQSKARKNPNGPLEEALPVRRSRRITTASASFDDSAIQFSRPALSLDVTEKSNKTEFDEDSDSTPKILPSRNRSISTNPSLSRKRKKGTAKSSKSKRKKFIFGAFDNLDDFIDSEISRREVFGGDSDEEDQKVPVVQASARGLTRDPNRGGKYMVVDSGDEEDSDIEVECISSEDEDMEVEGSRSNASSAGCHVDSVEPPSSEHDGLSKDKIEDDAVAPGSDGVESASHESSRTIVGDQASEADPGIQGDSPDNESIDPAVSMPSADKTGVEREETLAVKTEEEEGDLPNIAETSSTITDQTMPSSATLDNEGPFFEAISGRYQSHPPPDIHQQSHTARSPTLPRGFQQALQEIEDDLNSQQEERRMSRAPRFGDFPSESP